MELVRTILVGPRDDAVQGRLVGALRRSGIAYRTVCLHRSAATEGYLAVLAACEGDRQERAVEIIAGEIERLRRSEITASELDYARKLYRLSALSRRQDIRHEAYIAARDLLLGAGRAGRDQHAAMDRITAEDVARVVDRRLMAECRGVVLLRSLAIDSIASTKDRDDDAASLVGRNPSSGRGK